MSDTPYIYPNFDMRYAIWTGGGYSAQGDSPSFVPFTEQQRNVDGIDAFDRVSKKHDIDYDEAQTKLLSDLIAGRPRVDALIDYYTAISQADRTFVDKASHVTADHAWGEGIRGIGITVVATKALLQDSIIERLKYDEGYRNQVNGLSFDANTIDSALQAYRDKYSPEAKHSLVQILHTSALIETLSSNSSMIADGVAGQPELAAVVAADAVPLNLFTVGGTVSGAIEAAVTGISSAIGGAISEIRDVVISSASLFDINSLANQDNTTPDFSGVRVDIATLQSSQPVFTGTGDTSFQYATPETPLPLPTWYFAPVIVEDLPPLVTPPPPPAPVVNLDAILSNIQQSTYVPTQAPRCFAGATPVRMADGTEKPIADIVAGDNVMAFDGFGALTPARVARVHDFGEAEVVRLEAGGRTIEVTPLHRFLTGDGSFKSLAHFGADDRLVAADGTVGGSARVTGGTSRARIYNLTVENMHTYVAAGLRVHNTKPIVVDLDGNNRIELVGLDESGVLFDMDADGFAEHTAWVGAGDGVLAFDRDTDGLITNAAEFVFSRYGGAGASDLDGLKAAFDSNHDGRLDVHDADFARFGVWRDANQDGRAQAGEFVGLTALGIASFDLTAAGPARTENGNTLLGQGSFTRTDGSVGLMADVDLALEDNGYAEVARSARTRTLVGEDGSTAGAVMGEATLRLLNAATSGGVAFGSAGNNTINRVISNDDTLSLAA
ncbi:MAG: hypothetical protein ABT940_09670 [Alphaproteobacteria bacterium]